MSNKQNDVYLEAVDEVIEEIKKMMVTEGIRQLTSNEMKQRADNRRSITTAVRLAGGEVKEEYR